MSDRELLELAAKAAGMRAYWSEEDNSMLDMGYKEWNPLESDCDALRLAVKLDCHLQMDFDDDDIECVYCWTTTHSDGSPERVSETQDRYAATRRAIVRAAAAIGEQMK